MQVYSVVVDTDNFNSGLMGVFHTFTKAVDATVDFIKMTTRQDNRCQSVDIIRSDLDALITEESKSVFFYINHRSSHVVNDEFNLSFKILIRYPEDNQDILKILKEYKFPFNVTFKPWE
jgi:hypothetical protein